MFGKKEVKFQSKMKQSVDMIIEIASAFGKPVLAVTDSWFGNNGLWKPLHKELGSQFHMVSRLRSNSNLFDLPCTPEAKHAGRPRKYGEKLGNASSFATKIKCLAKKYAVNLYGKTRTIIAHKQVVMLKTLKCSVRVVWVFRKTQ